MEDKLVDGDVGMIEDLTFGLKNMIAIEDHALSSFGMTKGKKYLELVDIIRKLRTKWISVLVKKERSHLWCISKHLLASSMSMQEVANRFVSTGQTEEATEATKDSQYLFSLFCILNEHGGENVQSKPKTSA